MSDPRDKKSVCGYCCCELADCKCDNPVRCFAWRDNDDKFGIDLDSISETEDGVRHKCLQQSMGWRYDYDSHDQEWERLLTFGRIVPVVVSE